MKNSIYKQITFLFLSLVVSLYGLGFAYDSKITPATDKELWIDVSKDGWVVDGSRLIFPGLMPYLNKVKITWDNRRRDQQTAQLTIERCSGNKINIGVPTSGIETAIRLAGVCISGVQELRIGVDNPAKSNNKEDTRKLGAQIRNIEISSRFGVPVSDLFRLLGTTVVLYCLIAIGYITIGSIGAASILIGSFLLLIFNSTPLNLTNHFALAVGVGAILFGLYLGKRSGISYKNEKEVLKATDPTSDFWILLLIVVVIGAVLRFWGIWFGLPDNYHPDEVPKVNAISGMIARENLDPNYFLHPSLLLYSAFGISKILALLPHPDAFGTRELIALGGRITSCIAGILSIVFLYLIGRNLFNKRIGLVAASLLAVFPLHVTCSRYMKEDSLLVAMTLLTLFVVTHAVKKNQPLWLFLAGFFAGLSASSKYSGILNVVLLFSAPWLVTRSFIPNAKWLVYAALSCVFAPLGFLLGTPYSILNSERFILHFNSERLHMLKGHTIAITPWSELWVFHYKNSIFNGMTFVPAFLTTVACGFLLWTRSIRALFVVAMVGLYYLPAEWVNAKPPPQPDRYILPCLPFMALAFGYLINNIKISTVNRLSLFMLAFIFPLIRSTELAADLIPDTRELMRDYIVKNVPPGSKIYLDYPRYAPYLPTGMYDVEFIYVNGFAAKIPPGALKKSGYDYIVLSSLTYGRYTMNSAPQVAYFRSQLREVFSKVPVVYHAHARSGPYGFSNPDLTLFKINDPKLFEESFKEFQERMRGQRDITTNEHKAPSGPNMFKATYIGR